VPLGSIVVDLVLSQLYLIFGYTIRYYGVSTVTTLGRYRFDPETIQIQPRKKPPRAHAFRGASRNPVGIGIGPITAELLSRTAAFSAKNPRGRGGRAD